jgi:hypothetical protein
MHVLTADAEALDVFLDLAEGYRRPQMRRLAADRGVSAEDLEPARLVELLAVLDAALFGERPLAEPFTTHTRSQRVELLADRQGAGKALWHDGDEIRGEWTSKRGGRIQRYRGPERGQGEAAILKRLKIRGPVVPGTAAGGRVRQER